MALLHVVVAATCWLAPVDAPVADPFRPPACAWCPGNRGLEYATEPGTAVRAVAAGEVSFAGSVAGTWYLVVRLPDGRRVTYGGLERPASGTFTQGDPVVAGQHLGVTSGALFLALRAAPADGGDYVDPAPWIGAPVGRPRLIPTDGTDARPPPPPRQRCAAEHLQNQDRRAGAHE